MIYDSILGTIGKTPVVRIQRLAPPHVTMYVKCEFFNPCSSVKDRLAIAIIEDAERTGTLAPGQTVVEATLPDTGERYLSTALFEGIAEGADPGP
jgi:cysteine synthase A